jgi:hypothetical protein
MLLFYTFFYKRALFALTRCSPLPIFSQKLIDDDIFASVVLAIMLTIILAPICLSATISHFGANNAPTRLDEAKLSGAISFHERLENSCYTLEMDDTNFKA